VVRHRQNYRARLRSRVAYGDLYSRISCLELGPGRELTRQGNTRSDAAVH